MTTPNPGEMLAFYVVFVYSTSLHEAAHAWVATKGGDPTAYKGGQVTLDPRPHIKREPFGMVVLPLLSLVLTGWPLGFASAPYDRHWARRHPNRSAWMALAGPGMNLALCVFAALLVNVGLFTGLLVAPESIDFAHVTAAAGGAHSVWGATAFVVGLFFSLNLLLCVFNLLPIPPLDGSGALPLVLPKRVVPKYLDAISSNSAYAWIGVLIAWQIFGDLFTPIFFRAIDLLYASVGASYG
ncbi:MAG: site-2 protease family protein [Planctomycetes bacterium]|nr:site-2 protease family protein [Planctomycetota bacterium]